MTRLDIAITAYLWASVPAILAALLLAGQRGRARAYSAVHVATIPLAIVLGLALWPAALAFAWRRRGKS